MRRIRQIPPGVSQAAFARLSLALVLSATLHTYVIYGLALQPAGSAADHRSIINARLLPEPTAVTRPTLAAPATLSPRIPPAQPPVAPVAGAVVSIGSGKGSTGDRAGGMRLRCIAGAANAGD
ncbi:MAG: hypothetical protein ACT4PQ_11615, partial [Betaproteobacteria bacterium]